MHPGKAAALVRLRFYRTFLAIVILALLLTLTPVGRLFAHRYGNALMVGSLTVIADAWSHPGRFGFEYGEALLTGLVSGVLALAGWPPCGSAALKTSLPFSATTWTTSPGFTRSAIRSPVSTSWTTVPA